MAFGTQQGSIVLLAEQTVTESTVTVGSATVEKATELFVVLSFGTLADVVSWALKTGFSFQATDVDDWIESQAGSGVASNDEVVIQYLLWPNIVKVHYYDSSAGTWSTTQSTGTNAVFPMEDLRFEVTTPATAGNYTFNGRIFIKG